MHWGWWDYCMVPAYHKRVLIDLIQDEVRQQKRERERVERRAQRRA